MGTWVQMQGNMLTILNHGTTELRGRQMALGCPTHSSRGRQNVLMRKSQVDDKY